MARNKTQQQDTEDSLPFIDPVSYYDTQAAAALLGLTELQLRQYRHRKTGPRYQQPMKNSRVQYLGQWLIEYRRSITVEPMC